MSRLFRITAVAALGVSVATPPMAPPAFAQTQAQTRPASSGKALDGEPTPAACAPFGFRLPQTQREVARSFATPIVVTGSRVQANAATSAPPPAPPPPPPPPPPAPPAPMRTERVPLPPISPPPGAPANTERYPDATPNPVKRTADQPVSTFSIDVDTAAYANVRRFIDEGRRPPKDAVRVEELINAFDYGYDRPTSQARPFSVTTAITASPWAAGDGAPQADRGGRQIVHIGLQGYELPEAERRPLNLTFLVDVSGSMNSPDKLDLAKKAMNLAIDRLRPQDTLAVTYYAEGAGTTLAPTPGDQKLKMRCAVASLKASGGTAGATGMTNAYDQAQANFARDKVNRILMFTDGDFNVGVTDDKRLEDYVADKRQTGIYLSVYGFGRGNYQDARMQAIAQAGNGVAAYVDSLREARRLFGPAFDKGAFPIADDVKIQVEFNPARVAEWRLIGYETRLLNEEDFANDRIDAGEVGSGASVTALYEITPVGGATQVPERRYPDNRIGIGGGDPNGEIGFIQIRYKQPGQSRSELIQQPLTNAATGPVGAQPPEATRWALAVAAFGQKLRDDPWMAADYGWDQIVEQAQGARGDDPYGDRAEFVQLVRAAKDLPPARTP